MNRKAENNLNIIKNFILHLTHCDDYEAESDYNSQITLTPRIIYQAAKDYIKEDHVDGYGEDSERCIDIWLEAEEANRNDDCDEAIRLKEYFSKLYDSPWVDQQYVDEYIESIAG